MKINKMGTKRAIQLIKASFFFQINDKLLAKLTKRETEKKQISTLIRVDIAKKKNSHEIQRTTRECFVNIFPRTGKSRKKWVNF